MHTLIKTKQSHCKDCYKCLRHCTVKAIQIKEGHAQIVPERCILCGKCISICPQGAKQVFSNLDAVKNLLQHNRNVVVSLAPTFPVAFPEFTPSQIVRALTNLGFSGVEETSVGASYVSRKHIDLLADQDFIITSDCPALVNLVMTYHPELKNALAKIDSPMNAHAKLLKKAFKDNKDIDIKVVFIGPCIAKMSENSTEPCQVDYVLSFDDLKQWFNENSINSEVIDATPLEDSLQDKLQQSSRLYPIQGGMLQSIGLDQFDVKNLTITGFKDCKHFLESINEHKSDLKIVEMMICDEGCLGGPFMHQTSPQLSRHKMFKYAMGQEHIPYLFDYSNIEVNVTKEFKEGALSLAQPSEDEISDVLKKIGKYNKEDELNCGACGYYSCRDKAKAVIQGMAELEMCMPYMRKKAESRANKIIDRDPNGVCEVDETYGIMQYNDAFKNIFELPPYFEIIGKDIRDYVDANIFDPEYCDKSPFILKSNKVNKEMEVLTFDLVEDNMHVAIVTDITQKLLNREKINDLKEKTIEKATEVIHKQMRVAQEIASLLGETTAESKVILLDLMKVFREETKE